VASLLQLLGTRECKQVKTEISRKQYGACLFPWPMFFILSHNRDGETSKTLKEAGSFEIPAPLDHLYGW